MTRITIKFLFAIILIIGCNSCTTDESKVFRGVVSTASPEATDVGEAILIRGGNAIDAAVAISFALGVTEPAMSGLGGGTQVLLSLKDQPPIAINGTTLSPESTPTNSLDTLTYHRRSTIPSTVKVLDHIWRKYGSGNLEWADLLAPAIDLAENGFIVGEYRAIVYQQYEERLLKSKHNVAYFLIDGSRIPIQGDRLKQPVLAKTLKRLAEYGADDFYNGEIAKIIADDMSANGGWITLKDLNNFPSPTELTPLSVQFKDTKIYSQPPPCGGWTALLAINLMNELLTEDSLSNENIVTALYLAQMDRDNAPITELFNFESFAERKLSKNYAVKLLNNESLLTDPEGNSGGETTHFSVVDASGNALAVTASINAYFGALASTKELGFLYNTYMDDFVFENPDHPFAIRPGAMAYSSMAPTIVQRNNQNSFVIGSPGSRRIISTVAQLTAKWIMNGDLNKLMGQPRIHVSGHSVYFENKQDTIGFNKHLLPNTELSIKSPSERLVIKEGVNAYFGGVQAIAKENGEWIGVADPRRDGKAVIVHN